MKKYFAMSIIAASVALAACSDDDDDDPVVDGGTTTDPVVTAPPATPGEGNTALDFVVNSESHQQLEDLVVAAGLADTLDDPAAQFTIFAPTDAAFEALETATPGTLAALSADTDALARVLKHHVLEGSIQSDEVIAGVSAVVEGEAPFSVPTLATGAPAQSLTFTANAEGTGYDITDGSGNVVPLTGPLDQNVAVEVEAPTTGVVHVIENVLLPVDADPVEEMTEEEMTEEEMTGEETTEPGVATGAGDEILATAGNAEIYRAGIVTHFTGNLDDQAWTFFVPNDTDLGAAGVTELSGAQMQAHIVSSSAIDPTTLAGSGSVTASDGGVYTVAVDEDGNTTVSGFAVELIGTGAMGAQIYSVAGVLGGS